MPSPSTRLRIAKPSTEDPFSTTEIASNWQIVDDFPGRFVCTSTTRPQNWGANQNGMSIYETDSDLEWEWTGSTWTRHGPVGWLNGTERTSDFSTNQTAAQTVVSTAVTVPAGGRRVRCTVTWPKAEATGGVVRLYVVRDTTTLQAWNVSGKLTPASGLEEGTGGSLVLFDTPSAGSRTYYFKTSVVVGYTGSVYLRAAAGAPISINVEEV